MDFPWDRASCRELEPGDDWNKIFFPGAGRPPTNPKWKKYCDICQIRYQCLRWAIAHDEDGVWGGTTETERQLMEEIAPDLRAQYIAEAKAEGWYSPPISAAQLFASLRFEEEEQLEPQQHIHTVEDSPNYTTINGHSSVFRFRQSMPLEEPDPSPLEVLSEVRDDLKQRFLFQFQVLGNALQEARDSLEPEVPRQSVFASVRARNPNVVRPTYEGSSVFRFRQVP